SRTWLRSTPSQQVRSPVMVRSPPMVLSLKLLNTGDWKDAKIPVAGTAQVTPPPPPRRRASPRIVLAWTMTASARDPVTSPDTWFWPFSVPPVAAFGSSVQGMKLGSQPMPKTAPCPTLMSPRTVRLDVPVLATSLSANVAFRTEPGARIRSLLITAAPPLTWHTPVTTTLPRYVPASTPGAVSVPVQVLGRW